jgi:hypothetical protein
MAAVTLNTTSTTNVFDSNGQILFRIEKIASSDPSHQLDDLHFGSTLHPGASELFTNMGPLFTGKIEVSTPDSKAALTEWSTLRIPFTILSQSATYYCLSRMKLDQGYIEISGYLLEGDLETNLTRLALQRLFPRCAEKAYIEGRSPMEADSIFREKIILFITSGKYDSNDQKIFLIFDLDETLVVTIENSKKLSPHGRYVHSCGIEGTMEVSNERFEHSIMINPAAACELPLFANYGPIRFLTAGDRAYGEAIVVNSTARKWTTMNGDMDVCHVPFTAADVYSVRNHTKKAIPKTDSILPLPGCLPYLGIDNNTSSWKCGSPFNLIRVPDFTKLPADYDKSWSPEQKRGNYFTFALIRIGVIAHAYHTNPLSFKWAVSFLGITEQHLEDAVRNIERERVEAEKREEARQIAIEKQAGKLANEKGFDDLTDWLNEKERLENELTAAAAEKTLKRRASAESIVEVVSDVADMFTIADEKASIIHMIREREIAQQAIIVAECKRQQEVCERALALSNVPGKLKTSLLGSPTLLDNVLRNYKRKSPDRA